MKMKSKALFVSGAVVALMVMGLLIANHAVSAATSQPITASVVAQHSTASDCWFIISGKVYDVTSYIPYHPGGQGSIVSYCGRDATAAFGGIGHSSNAQAMLQGYYIGDLATAPPVNETQPPVNQTQPPVNVTPPVNATPPFNYTGPYRHDDYEDDDDEDDEDDENEEEDDDEHDELPRHREGRHTEDDDENDDDEGFQLQRQRHHSGAGRESRSLSRREED